VRLRIQSFAALIQYSPKNPRQDPKTQSAPDARFKKLSRELGERVWGGWVSFWKVGLGIAARPLFERCVAYKNFQR